MDNTRLASGLVFMAAIGSGIVAGVFFAFSSFVMAALGRISPTQAVAAMNSINVTAVNPGFMTHSWAQESFPSLSVFDPLSCGTTQEPGSPSSRASFIC